MRLLLCSSTSRALKATPRRMSLLVAAITQDEGCQIRQGCRDSFACLLLSQATFLVHWCFQKASEVCF